MKITVKNVAKILEADVALDGVTAIAGYNNMGKSTILKAAYVIFNTFRNSNSKIIDARKRSVRSYFLKQETYFDENGFDKLPRNVLIDLADQVNEHLLDFMSTNKNNYKMFKKLFVKSFEVYRWIFLEDTEADYFFSDKFILPLYNGFKEICLRDKNEDIRYMGDMYILNVFKGQLNSLGVGSQASIHIDSDKEKYFISVKDNKIDDMSYSANAGGDVFFLPAYNLLDMVGASVDRRVYSPENDIRDALLTMEEEPVFEEYQEIKSNTKAIRNILGEVIHGKLDKLPSGQLSFMDNDVNDYVSIGNIASGMKNFLIIQSLVEKGRLKRNSILLIDEPETNLHPEWHLKFAELLVLMYQNMGVRSIVNSHSPYFIRALEVKMADYGMKNKGHYYLMEETGKNQFKTQDVTESTDRIYELLYRPLEYLS